MRGNNGVSILTVSKRYYRTECMELVESVSISNSEYENEYTIKTDHGELALTQSEMNKLRTIMDEILAHRAIKEF